MNGVAGSQGNVGGGERISMAVLRNSDSVTGFRFVPLHHPNAPRAFGSASACFTPMSSLLTSFYGRLRPCRLLGNCPAARSTGAVNFLSGKIRSSAGKLETGRALDYFESGDDNRKLCSLYLGIMDRMGVNFAEFGDAKTRLAGF